MLRPNLSCQTCILQSGLFDIKGGKMCGGWQGYTDTLMLQVLLPLEMHLRKSQKHSEDQELISEPCTWQAKGLAQASEVG